LAANDVLRASGLAATVFLASDDRLLAAAQSEGLVTDTRIIIRNRRMGDDMGAQSIDCNRMTLDIEKMQGSCSGDNRGFVITSPILAQRLADSGAPNSRPQILSSHRLHAKRIQIELLAVSTYEAA